MYSGNLFPAIATQIFLAVNKFPDYIKIKKQHHDKELFQHRFQKPIPQYVFYGYQYGGAFNRLNLLFVDDFVSAT